MPRDTTLQLPLRVWDAPTRLFHWALVVFLPLTYIFISLDWLQLHKLLGYLILAMLIFRLAWGFVGSHTSRFAAFLVSPIEGLRHLSGFARREPDRQIGHNAAGGWMVLVMLALLLVQAVTGLFAHPGSTLARLYGDQSGGPLATSVSAATSDTLTTIHAVVFKLLLGLTVVHVAAIIAYAVLKGQDLVRPMWTGKKRLPAATPAPALANPVLAGAIFAGAAVLVTLLAGWI